MYSLFIRLSNYNCSKPREGLSTPSIVSARGKAMVESQSFKDWLSLVTFSECYYNSYNLFGGF